MPRKNQTNVQMIKQGMEYSDYGALSQAFVIEAIAKYAAQVAQHPASVFDSGLLSGAAWKGVAKEWQDRIDAHIKS